MPAGGSLPILTAAPEVWPDAAKRFAGSGDAGGTGFSCSLPGFQRILRFIILTFEKNFLRNPEQFRDF